VIGINTKVLCFDFKVGLDIGTNVFWPVFGDDLPVLSKNLRNERNVMIKEVVVVLLMILIVSIV